MRAARIAEELLHLRRRRRHLLALGVLAVEDADRIGLDALAAILAEVGRPRAQIGLQCFAILRAAIAVAQRIQMHFKRNAQYAQPAIQQFNLLGVDARPRTSKGLDTDLGKLAIPPALLPLAAEHGPQIPP